ncbi:hypothetical protein KXV33_001952 [Aspergillus fumigatus]|nr:hypothetical protein KXV33_001952 [Aspergillus fumigatus]
MPVPFNDLHWISRTISVPVLHTFASTLVHRPPTYLGNSDPAPPDAETGGWLIDRIHVSTWRKAVDARVPWHGHMVR